MCFVGNIWIIMRIVSNELITRGHTVSSRRAGSKVFAKNPIPFLAWLAVQHLPVHSNLLNSIPINYNTSICSDFDSFAHSQYRIFHPLSISQAGTLWHHCHSQSPYITNMNYFDHPNRNLASYTPLHTITIAQLFPLAQSYAKLASFDHPNVSFF